LGGITRVFGSYRISAQEVGQGCETSSNTKEQLTQSRAHKH